MSGCDVPEGYCAGFLLLSMRLSGLRVEAVFLRFVLLGRMRW